MLMDRSFAEAPPERATDEVERRAVPRVAFETDVSIATDTRTFSGLSANVSLSGIFVAAYGRIPEGTRVSIRFRLPTGQIVADGVVRWTREPRPGTIAGMGLELIVVDDADRQALEQFCGSRPRFLSYEEIVASTE